MKLKVINNFLGKDEGKELVPGDVITTNDIARVNALVGRGYCEIISIDDPENPVNGSNEESVEFQGVNYEIGALKAALEEIGAPTSPNAKEKGIKKALDKLTDEQKSALVLVLNKEE